MLLDQAIVALCATYNPAYNAPCRNSILAGTKQIGVYDQINNGERVFDHITEKSARDNMGDTTIIIVGGTYFVAKAIQNKGLDFALPTLGICDSASNHVGVGAYSLRIGWNF